VKDSPDTAAALDACAASEFEIVTGRGLGATVAVLVEGTGGLTTAAAAAEPAGFCNCACDVLRGVGRAALVAR
jgi:hypothetical protein